LVYEAYGSPYDLFFLVKVHAAYGSPDDLRAFVDKAHELGIAVMVDICLNHGSSRLNSLW
jgi:1,4-alpha-glucan branching enzyme